MSIIMASGRKKAEKAIASSEVKSLDDLNSKREYFRCRIPQIDFHLGGIPKGCIGQVASKQGIGKTTICLQAGFGVLSCLPEHYKFAFCDFEGRLLKNWEMVEKMMRFFGIKPKRFLFKEPMNGQDGLQQISDWLFDTEDVALILGDSLKAVIDKANIKKKIDESHNARGNAKLVNEWHEKVLNKFPDDKTLLWIDHLKSEGGMFPTNETKSGETIKFYASWRIFLAAAGSKQSKTVEEDIERFDKQLFSLKVVKTTVSPMLKINKIPLKFGSGVILPPYVMKKGKQEGLLVSKVVDKGKKHSIVYIKENGEEIVLGKTKPEIARWYVENRNTIFKELEDRLYDIYRNRLDIEMSAGISFDDSAFSF